ncbi:MAG: Holliday junction branch migration protein RuvA [Cryobacterium sp.]|nr:Holliday junction branch migration protein RuvA [Oligoflexia bacterium]
MIGYLQGQIFEIQDGKAVLFNSQTGVGYSVTLPANGRYATLHAGLSTALWVHTHVREDALDLYGFLSREEKEIFLTLLTVNGIGPKGAIGILSKVEIPTLVRAILEGDQASLTEIPGIGKKTAERVVVELKDSLKKKAENGALPAEWLAAAATLGAASSVRSAGSAAFAALSFKEARDALVGLGYRDNEVVQALKRVQDAGAPGTTRTEDVVKLALKEIR